MKCAFCKAANDSKANFCSSCGSPLNLQLCHACESVNDQAATSCTQCGVSLNPATTALATGEISYLAEKNRDIPSDKAVNTEEWKDLLETLQVEVEQELNLWKALTSEEASAKPTAPAWEATPQSRSSITHRALSRNINTIEVSRPRWYQSSLLWIVIIGWAATVYFLYPSSVPSTQDAPAEKPSTRLSAPKPTSQQLPRAPFPAITLPEPMPNSTTLRINNWAVPTAYAYNNNPLINTAPVSAQPDSNEREQVKEKASEQHKLPAKQSLQPSSKAMPSTASSAQVVINVSPWGKIYIDGKRRGISPPLTKFALAPGKHSIEIRNSDLPSYLRRVDLDAGESIRIKHKFSGK